MRVLVTWRPVAFLSHVPKVPRALQGGTWFLNLPKTVVLYVWAVLVISAIYVIGVSGNLLVLLEDILLEVLLAVTIANFSFWIWFHSSYFERVNTAEQQEVQRVRTLMRRIQESAKLGDSELDNWLRYVSDRYWRIGSLRASMQGTVDGFKWGGILGLVGIVLEIISTLNTSNPDVHSFSNLFSWAALFLSTSQMLFAIFGGNRLMRTLSERPH